MGRKLTGEEFMILGETLQRRYIPGIKKRGKIDDGN